MDCAEQSVVDDVTEFIHSFLPKKKPLTIFTAAVPRNDNLSDIHKRAKSVYPDCFHGAKIAAVRDVLDKVRLSQQYTFKYMQQPYKSFTHFLYKEMEPKLKNELFIDTSGSATVTYQDRTNYGTDFKILSKIKDVTASDVEVTLSHDYKQGTGSMIFCVDDMNPQNLRVVTQYLYQASPQVSLGAELFSRPLAGMLTPELSVSGRYARPNNSISATINTAGFQICLFRQLSRQFEFASIIDFGNYSDKETTLSMAIRNNLDGDTAVKMFIDSNQNGGFTVERMVRLREPNAELKSLRIVASALMDRRRRIQFGIAFLLDL